MYNVLLQAASGNAAGNGSLLMTVIPFALIFVIFYFFLIRPQNKKQKETEKMIAALKKGDKVVTIGGIHGVVSSTKEKTVILKLDENAKVEFSRSAIASVDLPKDAETTDSKKKAKEVETSKVDEVESNKTEEK